MEKVDMDSIIKEIGENKVVEFYKTHKGGEYFATALKYNTEEFLIKFKELRKKYKKVEFAYISNRLSILWCK
jgi:hypothetical protein